MLAVEEAVQPRGEMCEAIRLVVRAGERAAIAVGVRRLREAEEVGHVVIGGFAAGVPGIAMLTAGCRRVAGCHPLQEAEYVGEEIAGHHGGRNRRIADHLAGQHQRIGARENGVEVMEVIDRVHFPVALGGGHLDAEFLIAVERPDEQLVGWRAPDEFGDLQVGDVAHHALALVTEIFAGRRPADAG